MPQYSYPKALARGMRIILLSLALGGSALIVIRTLGWYQVMAPMAAPGPHMSQSASAALIGELRMLLVKFAAIGFVGVWAYALVASWLTRRLWSVSYTLDDTTIARTRGKAAKSVSYADVTSVKYSIFRGLLLEAPHGTVPVSLGVDGAPEMLERLRISLAGAGVDLPAATYDRAQMWAAFNSWGMTYLWWPFIWLMALLMPVWSAMCLAALLVWRGGQYNALWAVPAASVPLAIFVMPLSAVVLSLPMFRHAWKAGQRDVGRPLATKTMLAASLVTLVLLAVLWTAVLSNRHSSVPVTKPAQERLATMARDYLTQAHPDWAKEVAPLPWRVIDHEKYWEVTWDLPSDTLGGTPVVHIDKSTRHVTKASHGQ